MTVFATDTYRASHLVKREFWPEEGFCRRQVTVNETAAKTYVVGTVLGKVTATGKYKVSVQSATDGSEVPAAVVFDDASIAANTDTKLVVLVKGPAVLSKGALVLDASFDLTAEKDAAYAALEALDFQILDTI